MVSLLERLPRDPELDAVPLAQGLLPVLVAPTSVSSGGFPVLAQAAFETFRDTVPHLLGMGPRVLVALEAARAAATRLGAGDEERASLERAAEVVHRCVLTAAITAPSDLWLLRFVLGTLQEVGLLSRILDGEPIDPAQETRVVHGGREMIARAEDLESDLSFLLSRGYLDQDGAGRFVAPVHPRARDVLSRITPVPDDERLHASKAFADAFAGRALDLDEVRVLSRLGREPPRRERLEQSTWIATLEEIELGYRLLPVVLGLRASGVSIREGAPVRAEQLAPRHPEVGAAALAILEAAGVVAKMPEGYVATEVGRRVLTRGPGPMGIIEAYRPYMARLADILVEGRGAAWVTRSDNIAASQDANRATFERANAALDAFCRDTGFSLRVFIEHAIGRGEATRQRFTASGDEQIRYVGADLEDAAIDACLEEQRAGRLPANMVFARQADIGRPELLIGALRDNGIDPEGAVMIVGNGFHEVREQTDERMIEVFRGYEEAGVLLLFTEENALSVDDLLHTGWNTYHAGFKYVHEKSGQGLRPAEPAPTPRYGRPLNKSWSECARLAGYVRADRYCSKSRTIYPTTPKSGHNPSISVNHFFVPGRIAKRLSLG